MNENDLKIFIKLECFGINLVILVPILQKRCFVSLTDRKLVNNPGMER